VEAVNFKRSSEEEILRAFQALDVDKKGYLEEAELKSFMMNPKSAEKFDEDEVIMSESFSCRFCGQQSLNANDAV
jgi:Ca2+-binding EF-hand superfamily protein